MQSLSTRARYILRTKGLRALITAGLKFLIYGFYDYGPFYLYEISLKDRDEANYRPKIENFTFKIISTNQEADELASHGLDFRSGIADARQKLDKGAIAFCVFIGQELASIGFVAMTQEAQVCLGQPPYKVDFSNGEACTGSAWTNPNYRALGLLTYVYYKRLQFLKDKRKVIARVAVHPDSFIIQRMLAKFSPKIWAVGYGNRILWHNYWKEEPFKDKL